MYRSISGISSQALPRKLKDAHISENRTLVIGAAGATSSSFSPVTADSLLDGWRLSLSPGNTLVGFGESVSHGKIGVGF